jgi:hypothetical protein
MPANQKKAMNHPVSLNQISIIYNALTTKTQIIQYIKIPIIKK